MEESPEQVLARLARYRDSLNGRPRSPIVGPARAPTPTPRPRPTPRPTPVAAQGAADSAAGAFARESARAWDYSGTARAVTLNVVRATVAGHVLAVVACVFGVLCFEHLDHGVALAVVAVATAFGLTASVRRVPLALWWTLGVVIGGALGRWS